MKLQQLEAIHLYIPAQYYSGKRFPFLFVHYLSNRTEITPLNKKLSLNHPGVRFDQEDGYGLPLILVQPDRRRGFPDISLSLQVFLNERKKAERQLCFISAGTNIRERIDLWRKPRGGEEVRDAILQVRSDCFIFLFFIFSPSAVHPRGV